MKLGVLQGRLSEPIDNNIQEFPNKNWENEFLILNSLGLNHIEWIITKKSFQEKQFQKNVKKYSNLISGICCDHLINDKIVDIEFLEKNLTPICDWSLENNIFNINIPLLEESKISDINQEILIKNFSFFSKKYDKLKFHFEIESDIQSCLNLVKSNKNFYLIYDTGNITSCGYDHEEWIIKGLKYIKNIHLKDRTKKPIKTVEPLTGDTNFKHIFDLLKNKNYNYLFTIQTCRGESGKEIQTIKKHIQIFKNIYDS